LSLSFGWSTLAVALVVLGSGMAYNLWAKGTVYSWIPYSVAIPALPVWGFLAANRFTPIVLVSFALGALMSLALNLANTIPDLKGDTQYGLQGLTHRLGLERSLVVVWSSFTGTILLLAQRLPRANYKIFEKVRLRVFEEDPSAFCSPG
jgi:4-hydroxybenzoate polyprenyltransferase